MRLSAIALAVAAACGGLRRPRIVTSGIAYLGAGGPFGRHRGRQAGGTAHAITHTGA